MIILMKEVMKLFCGVFEIKDGYFALVILTVFDGE